MKHFFLAGAVFLLASTLFADSTWVLETSTLTYHADHPFHNTRGKTSASRGKGVCVQSGCDFLVAVPVNTFDSGDDNRDAHMLQARPSMMRALRDASLLVAVGAELEIGWLPAATASAANAAILPGKPGYFEAAAQVPLLDAGQAADRAHGDVHSAGNPHVNLDPVRMASVAKALAERLAQLDAANAVGYRERALGFGAAVEAKLPGWKRKTADSGGAVLYHKDAAYLLHAGCVRERDKGTPS